MIRVAKKNVFIIETRGSDTSRKIEEIFLMEPRQIVPVAREVEAGFWQLVQEITPLVTLKDSVEHVDNQDDGVVSGRSY